MVRKKNLPDDISPCRDCVLLICEKYADKRTEMNDPMDTLLIFEGNKVIKREPMRKMIAGCRHCRGYYLYQVSFLNDEKNNLKKRDI